MLTVAKVTQSAAAGYANYLEGRSQAPEAGDYYLSEGGERVEAPGRWVLGPRGVEALGVDPSQAIAAEAFRAVMHVQHPTSGEMLRRVGGNGEAVCAIDATFSAPKSVSAVWALAGPELRGQLEAAQEQAVDRALAYATEQVPMIRRRLDQSTVVREGAGEVLASSWRHTTARAVAGRAPDPQLHSHVLIHGAVRSDGRVVAVESRAWLVHQREVDAAYLSELAQGLQRLGFSVERETGRRERYFELAGVPEGLRERFSGRHAQVQAAIQERLAEKAAQLQVAVTEGGSADAAVAAEQLEALGRSGRLMPGEERAVAMRSRAAKTELLLTAGDLDRSWWHDAQPYDFDARTVEQLRHRQERAVTPLVGEDLDARVLQRLTEFEATFCDRDVRAAALVAGLGLPVDEALAAADRLQAAGELVELADGRLTTRTHRQMEARVVARARAVAGGQIRPVDPELAERELAVLDAQLRQAGADGLAGEQAQAIRTACAGGQLTVIEGQAGTGKSTALGAIARAHEHAGQRIIVTSTGALAAERLAGELREAGVDADGYSTMALRARAGSLELGATTTVIHDEAALASTREQDWLFGAVEDSGARLILVGDPRQSKAVGAGGLWERIETAARDHDAHVALRRIVRAQDPSDRRDQSLWRAGQHDRALAGYDKRERLMLDEHQQRAEDRALEGAHADRQAGRSTLVVAQTSNEHLDALNARAQAIRAQAGELGEREVVLAGRPYGLRAGDEVQVRHPVTHPELGRVSNGTTAYVLAVDDADRGGATLALSDGRQGVFERELLDAAQTRLAYVQHPFPAQGVTVDTAHVVCGEHATSEGSYVALTRARQLTHVYAGRDRLAERDVDSGRDTVVAAVAERMGRTEPEIPSIAVPLAYEQQVEVQHARESRSLRPSDGEDDQQRRRPRDELAQLRSERDRLREVVDSYPAETVGEILRLEGRAAVERQGAEGDAWRAGHWQGVYEDLGILARRRVEGRQARERAEGFAARADEQYQHAEQLEHHARSLAEGPGGPAAWERAHPDAREELYGAETRLAAEVDRRAHEPSDRSVAPTRGSGRGAAKELAWLRQERDRLRDQLSGYPRRQASEAEQADRRAQQADGDARAAHERAGEAGREYEQLGRLARRGQRGPAALERQQRFEAQAEHHQQRAEGERQTAWEARERPGGPSEWERTHPGVRDRLAVYEHAYEVAEARETRRSLARDPAVAVRVLGSRPQHPDHRKVWDQGARAIAAYRLAYGVTDQQHVLGSEPDRRDLEQHRDWEQAAQLALAARGRLGIGDERRLGPVAEQARRGPELTPPPPGRGPDRGLGFGM